MKILVINPGSTSTKLAVYEDNEQVWRKSVFHSAKDLSVFHHINEQYEYRACMLQKLCGRLEFPCASMLSLPAEDY